MGVFSKHCRDLLADMVERTLKIRARPLDLGGEIDLREGLHHAVEAIDIFAYFLP